MKTTEEALARVLKVRTVLELDPPATPSRYHHLGVVQAGKRKRTDRKGLLASRTTPSLKAWVTGHAEKGVVFYSVNFGMGQERNFVCS